jgi:hypothetical protein
MIIVDPSPHPTPPTSPVAHNLPAPCIPQPQLQSTLAPSPSPAPPHSTPRNYEPTNHAHPKPIDETLKPSDRRFFLQHSPEGDDSPERRGVTATTDVAATLVAGRSSGVAPGAAPSGSKCARGTGRGTGNRSASRSTSKRASSSSSSILVSKSRASNGRGTGKGKKVVRSRCQQSTQRQQVERTRVQAKVEHESRDCQREQEHEQFTRMSPAAGAAAIAKVHAGGGIAPDSCKIRAAFNFEVLEPGGIERKGLDRNRQKGGNEVEVKGAEAKPSASTSKVDVQGSNYNHNSRRGSSHVGGLSLQARLPSMKLLIQRRTSTMRMWMRMMVRGSPKRLATTRW